MMIKVFLTILNISLSSSFLIAFVFLLRMIARRRINRILCVLWLLVFVRLLCPFTVSDFVRISRPLPNAVSIIAPKAEETSLNSTSQQIVESGERASDTSPSGKEIPWSTIAKIGSIVWLIGVAALSLVHIFGAWRLKRALSEGIKEEDYYRCNGIEVPLVFGILRPRIYVPHGIADSALTSALAHEKVHIKHKDNIIKVLCTVVLTVYWFHPLVWIAFILLSRDLELACDDDVTQDMTDEEKRKYAMAVLLYSAGEPDMGQAYIGFASGFLKERMQNIISDRRKNRVLASLVWILGLSAFAVTLTFGAKSISEDRAQAQGESEPMLDGSEKTFDWTAGKYEIVILVWERGSGNYRCAYTSGNADWETIYDQADAMAISNRGMTVDQMREFLSDSEVPEDKVYVAYFPAGGLYFSHSGHSYVSPEDEEAYTAYLRSLFFN